MNCPQSQRQQQFQRQTTYLAFQRSQCTDTETSHVYLEYREANVEDLAQESFSLVGFLHERHVDVLIL